MGNFRKSFAVSVLLCLMIGLLPLGVNASSYEIQNQIEELQGRNQQIAAELDALEAQRESNYADIQNIVAEKYNIEQQMKLLYKQIENSNRQISAMNTMIADKQEELDAAQAHYEELHRQSKARIRTMEEDGSLSYWSVLFKAESFPDFLDRVNMIREIADADSRRMQALGEAHQEIIAAKTALEEEKSNLEEGKAQLNAEEEMLNSKKVEAQQLLILLLEREEEYMAHIQEAEAAKASLTDEIGQLQVAFEEAKRQEWEEYIAALPTEPAVPEETESPNEPDTQENPIIPDVPPEITEEGWLTPCYYVCVTDPYGWRIHPIDGSESFHGGVDLAANEGTPIYAARSGYVTLAEYHWSFGNFVSISHGDGFSSMYAHMMYSVVSEGEYVQQGQLIGYMGETGETTGPHLHFVIYVNGETVNPMAYI